MTEKLQWFIIEIFFKMSLFSEFYMHHGKRRSVLLNVLHCTVNTGSMGGSSNPQKLRNLLGQQKIKNLGVC